MVDALLWQISSAVSSFVACCLLSSSAHSPFHPCKYPRAESLILFGFQRARREVFPRGPRVLPALPLQRRGVLDRLGYGRRDQRNHARCEPSTVSREFSSIIHGNRRDLDRHVHDLDGCVQWCRGRISVAPLPTHLASRRCTSPPRATSLSLCATNPHILELGEMLRRFFWWLVVR